MSTCYYQLKRSHREMLHLLFSLSHIKSSGQTMPSNKSKAPLNYILNTISNDTHKTGFANNECPKTNDNIFKCRRHTQTTARNVAANINKTSIQHSNNVYKHTHESQMIVWHKGVNSFQTITAPQSWLTSSHAHKQYPYIDEQWCDIECVNYIYFIHKLHVLSIAWRW